ncbi:epidermal growth factor receptor substrate 15-like 1 [Olea europaea subsp. europaea]|uniref:Epidermal growth factor receptor substrate 15-like 1 n=1 Tax=Olea europaea subsp. europaea TaxID=158383 RepID=A0A8S0V5F9_OLEEU|nr:epidermal growth factor receptor substrate 15-like 1 [Olea europaea subsp. europaea]
MSGAVGGVNMELFEAYFRRADMNQDGKISGAEAVAFLQGSNLPKQVLAQIWVHTDQSHTGYLSRPEFYNFLKLVTVAQSKRELTPDIVKAALYGPASGKIPAPKINLAAIPTPQSNSVGAAPPLQIGAAAPASSNNLGFRGLTPSSFSINQLFGQAPSSSGMNQQLGPAPSSSGMNQQFRQVPPSTNMNQQLGQPISSTSMNQQYFSSQGNQQTRPLPIPAATASRPSPGPSGLNFSRGGDMVGPGLPNLNNDWIGGRTSVAPPTGPTPVSNRGASPSIPLVAPKLLDPLSTVSSTAAKDPKALVGSGNGFASESMFGGDVFSTTQSASLQASSASTRPASGIPTSSAIVPVSTGPQPSAKPDPFEAFQSTLVKPSTMVQTQQTSSLPKSNKQVSTQVTSFGSSSGATAGGGNSASDQSQISWPKMTRASVQKYAKVFIEVDTDRDGKISGEQAHSLFLSWRLPIEVLKQVWDLSDQDSDGMLSLREFCIALYLMERYREGRPLPSALPSSVMLDETLLSLAGPPTASYGRTGWGTTTGIRPQQLPHASASLRLPTQTVYSQPDGSMQFDEQNARVPIMDNSYTSELSNGEENSLDDKVQEAEEKVENKEKVLLDSREKIEFYRTKMQDLVLYKSRCDNRLNEITERALADKREAELLAKKYEEKYKQVAEIASKLTIEEASFREIQERKMELQQAIIKMEQGGSADGILQVRADRIQSDLEELLKAMAERCKKHDLRIKSTALIELPPGWQPGIPEFVSIWDEDWDKFEDEGFSFDVAVPANAKPTAVREENSSPTHNFSPDSTSEKPFSKGVSAFETESSYAYSEDESKSAQGSPARQTTFESPSPKYSENHFRKSSDGDAETHRSFDEPAWGTFDNNDDIDSVWGFDAKDSDHGKHEEKYFFGSSDFGASPERTDAPQKNSPFTFENSVPGSPLSRAGNSPRYSVESRDPFFDSSSRYDSFHTQDHISSPRQESLTRFDSMNSTRDFGHSGGFSFDDSDPFGSSGPFKVSSESQTSKKGSESW